MKKTLIALLLGCSFALSAQDSPSWKLYGFVRSDYAFDTRKIFSSAQELFSLYPMYADKNAAGEDLNATPSTSLTSISSRFGLQINATTGLFGAQKASARIETDFVGASPSFVLLRLRHAYTQLSWKNSTLLVGQTWHPMFTFGYQPMVLSFNTGALFQPFNRSPQIRYDYLVKGIKLTAAAIYEMQFNSYGPDATTYTANTSGYTFQRNALLPEFYVGLEAKSNSLVIGMAGEYKSVMPTRYVIDNSLVKHVNTSVLRTPGMMLYGNYTSGKLTVNAKAILGQNLTHLNLIGGYAITPDNRYIPYNTFSSFIHLNYGSALQFGLLGGYTRNLGPSSDLPVGSNIYGFGIDKANAPTGERIIRDAYRVTPSVSYSYKSWKMGMELEYTNAAWGNRNTTGQIVQPERIGNARLYAMLSYTF